MRKKRIKVLFILSRLLGGKTFSNAVVSMIRELHDIQPFFLFFDDEDWGKYQIPTIYKTFNKFIPAQTARSKLNLTFRHKDFDCVFIQSFELIQGFGDIIRKKPTILAHDSTDILGHRIVFNESSGGLINMLKFKLKNMLTMSLFKRAVKHVDIFMPRTSWCASSLVKDYCVSPTQIIITPCGIDLEKWRQKNYVVHEKPNLKFLT